MRRILIISLGALGALPAVAHDPISWHGSEIHVLLEANGTGGDLGMFTTRSPGPGGPPRHVHEDAGEAFYVLEGAAEFLVGEERVELGAGEAAFVPVGMEHTFHVLGDDGGKILVIVTPGGFEGFFAATKDLKLPDEMDSMKRISDDFGQIFTGPPLSAD